MGCDAGHGTRSSAAKCFNPRTRVGCDYALGKSPNKLAVSIHAPVWGATCAQPHYLPKYGFNPRTRVGCDYQLSQVIYQMMFQSTHPCGVRPFTKAKLQNKPSFQSTHPCGVRPIKIHKYFYRGRFNPRTRVGCDLIQVSLSSGFREVSIHAPVWGATHQKRKWL